MKKCGFWDEKKGECEIAEGECFDCKSYQTPTEMRIKRFKAAKRLSKLPYDDRCRIYNQYYQTMPLYERKKYYVSEWWKDE